MKRTCTDVRSIALVKSEIVPVLATASSDDPSRNARESEEDRSRESSQRVKQRQAVDTHGSEQGQKIIGESECDARKEGDEGCAQSDGQRGGDPQYQDSNDSCTTRLNTIEDDMGNDG